MCRASARPHRTPPSAPVGGPARRRYAPRGLFCKQRRRYNRFDRGHVRWQSVPVRFPCQHRRERLGDIFPIERAFPVSISYSTQPNAQMSLRFPPLGRVPAPETCTRRSQMIPTWVMAGDVIVGDIESPAGRTLRSRGAFRRPHRLCQPEVEHLTVPSGRTLMFAGFRSR